MIAPDAFAELARDSGATHTRCVIEEGENTVVTQQRWEAMLADPPSTVRRAIAQHDPDGSALMLISPWLEATSVLARPVFGARHPSWTHYEDKLAVDELWRAADVPAAPSRNVSLERAALAEASAALDHGHGTVWAADAEAGIHGGAVAVRWIRTKAEAYAAITAFERRHRRVRVMPFLAGRPCGIHGIAVCGDVIVLRPVEHVVVRHDLSGRLRQAGAGTGWDPPSTDRRHAGGCPSRRCCPAAPRQFRWQLHHRRRVDTGRFPADRVQSPMGRSDLLPGDRASTIPDPARPSRSRAGTLAGHARGRH